MTNRIPVDKADNQHKDAPHSDPRREFLSNFLAGTVTATVLLEKLSDGPLPPEEIMVLLKVPLFMLRGNLRELAELGLVREEEGSYHITEEGREKIVRAG